MWGDYYFYAVLSALVDQVAMQLGQQASFGTRPTARQVIEKA